MATRTPGDREAWMVADINGDMYEQNGTFDTRAACQEHIHEHIDGEAQREYGADSMFEATEVPGSRQAVDEITKHAHTLDVTAPGTGAATAERWQDAMKAAQQAAEGRTAENREQQLDEASGITRTEDNRPASDASDASDLARLTELVAAAEEVRESRDTPADPLGAERELHAALTLGKVRIQTDGRDESPQRATDQPGQRVGIQAPAPAGAPPRAAGAAEAAEERDAAALDR